MRLRSLELASALLLLTSACSDPAKHPTIGSEKLPGGASRLTNGAPGEWHHGLRWELVHELTIGSVEGGGADVFGAIGDIEIDREGRIFVLERQSNELRIFDASGNHVRTSGRTGGGPGEFDAANGLEWLPGTDSLLIADGSGMRYSIFDRDGHFVRSLGRPLDSHGYMFRGGFAKGLLYEEGLGAKAYQRVLVGMRLGSQAVLVDTVSFLKPLVAPVPSFEVRNARGGMYMQVPYVPTQAWHLATDATLWWGFGSEYRILQLTLQGDTLREVVIGDRRPVPVSQEDLQEWQQSEYVESFRKRGGVIDFDRIPRHKPFFTELLVDPEGFLWVDVSTADGLTAFDVFDSENRLLGRVATGIQRTPYVKPLVRNGRLYLVGVNDLNVPFIYVFRIDRPVG